MRVLVTADSATGRRELQTIVEFSGHLVLDSAELGAGALLATAVWDVDAVVAGFFASRPSLQQRSAVLVEVGIALGRGTPVLLLAREGIQATALTGVPWIEASLADPETLSLKLDLFLQGVRSGIPRQPATGTITSPKQRPSSTTYPAGYELERAVAELLKSSGTALFTEVRSDSPNDRPDLAFYLEGRESELGLILVEVKHLDSTANPQRRLRDASMQLARYVAQTNAGLGLVIYDGDKFPQQRRTREPLVVAIPLIKLRDELAQRSLGDVVRRLRNEAIHGL